MVVLRSGTSIYIGTIISYTSATVVTLDGDNLPETNQATFDTITMAGTTLTGNVLDFSAVSMLRYGNQLNMQILSSVTNNVEVFSRAGFPKWSTTAAKNVNTIIYAVL